MKYEKNKNNCIKDDPCGKCHKEKIRACYATLITILLLGTGLLVVLYLIITLLIQPIPIPTPFPPPFRSTFGESINITNTKQTEVGDITIPFVVFNFATIESSPQGQSTFAYVSNLRTTTPTIQILKNVTAEIFFGATFFGDLGPTTLFFKTFTLACPGFPFIANGIPNPNCDVSEIVLAPIPFNQLTLQLNISTSVAIPITKEKPQAFFAIVIGIATSFQYFLTTFDLTFSARSLGSFSQ